MTDGSEQTRPPLPPPTDKTVGGSQLVSLARGFLSRKRQADAEGRFLRTPFVRMPFVAIRAALQLAEAGEGDVVVDVGSGSGNILLMASAQQRALVRSSAH